MSFAHVLHDEWAIAAYIQEVSTDEICEETARDLFFDSHATLQWVSVHQIQAGNEYANIACEKKQARYRKLPSASRPPIVLNFEGDVVDGNHRLRDALARGESHILAYVPGEGRLQQVQVERQSSLALDDGSGPCP